MRKLILLAGVAAFAAGAIPASAEKGGHGGGGGRKGGGHGPEMHGGHGGGGHAQHGGSMAHAPKMHGPDGAGHGAAAKAERHAVKPFKVERQAFREAEKRDRFSRAAAERFDARSPEPRFAASGGCAPGLAKKSPACVPPGQAKKFGLGDRAQSSWLAGNRIPRYYSRFYPETSDYSYRYDDNGYIYRVDRSNDLVSAIIPLFGGGFAVGQPLPAGYDVYNVPLQYRDVYQDSDEDMYRYGDNAIYRVDNQSGLIESVVALLTGDINIGQPLPAGYDAYNLPMDYRDRYQDSDESLYRYADGNIFQVDPKTMLVQAIIEKLI
jgi:hypothetical protein